MDAVSQHLLHEHLDRTLGPEPAGVLMDALTACATREDLRVLKHELLHEVDLRLEARLGTLGATFHRDLGGVQGGLRVEMAELRDTLRGEMNELRDSLRGEMVAMEISLRREIASLHRSLFFEMAGLLLVVLAAMRIVG